MGSVVRTNQICVIFFTFTCFFLIIVLNEVADGYKKNNYKDEKLCDYSGRFLVKILSFIQPFI